MAKGSPNGQLTGAGVAGAGLTPQQERVLHMRHGVGNNDTPLGQKTTHPVAAAKIAAIEADARRRAPKGLGKVPGRRRRLPRSV